MFIKHKLNSDLVASSQVFDIQSSCDLGEGKTVLYIIHFVGLYTKFVWGYLTIIAIFLYLHVYS